MEAAVKMAEMIVILVCVVAQVTLLVIKAILVAASVVNNEVDGIATKRSPFNLFRSVGLVGTLFVLSAAKLTDVLLVQVESNNTV